MVSGRGNSKICARECPGGAIALMVRALEEGDAASLERTLSKARERLAEVAAKASAEGRGEG